MIDKSRKPAERHVQRARNRRRRQREHVDVRAQTLQALLVLHAEPMLLVDDRRGRAFLNRTSDCSSLCVPITMSTVPSRVPRSTCRGRRRAAEARQELDAHGPIGEPVLERADGAAPRATSSARARRPGSRLSPRRTPSATPPPSCRSRRRRRRPIHRPLAAEILEHALDRDELVLGFLERKFEREPPIARFPNTRVACPCAPRAAHTGSEAPRRRRAPAAAALRLAFVHWSEPSGAAAHLPGPRRCSE